MATKIIIVPVEFIFTTDPAEMDGREDEPTPTKDSLVEYLQRAIRLDVDNEGEGQPEGACFASAGVHWDEVGMVG